MPSLLGRLRGLFRTDAAAPPPSTALAPAPQRRNDAFNLTTGGFANPATGVGMPGVDPRMASTYSSGFMTDEQAIALWRGTALARKLVSTLPEEALEPGFTLTIQQDNAGADGARDARDAAELVERVDTLHRSLGTIAAIRRASEWDRLFGGAAIWIGANDMEAGDWSAPLNVDAPALRINWLRVLRPSELFPHRYYTDPLHPRFGEVEIWQLASVSARMAATALPTVYIHESRLCLFRGRRIVTDGTVASQNPHNSFEFGDGILLGVVKTIRRFEEALDNIELSMRANGELIWQHERLSDILAVEGGEEDFKALVRAMDYAQSVLRARVIGAGQSLTRSGAPLTGLADIVTKFENELAALGDMPRTKLFGESPGGLGANGENSQQDWDRSCATYRKNHQQPTYELITALILRSLGGLPKRWKVEGNKYRELSAKEQAELTKLDADTDIALAAAGIIPQDVIQQRSVWRDRYQLPEQEADALGAGGEEMPEDIREPGGAPAPGDPAAAPAGQPAPEGPKLAELALNGAQALALSAIVEKVAAGTMPRESGAQLVQFSFKVPPDQAEKMMPPTGYKPAAVEGGLQAAPAGAPAPEASVTDAPPRRDATRTMAALLAELAPDGCCDDCGQPHPLEVDHIDGRGWDPAALSKAQRTARYWQEFEEGVKLRALCRSCNARDGALNKQGRSGPRHRADAINLGGNVRFTYAPLPDELVASMRALQDEVVPVEGVLQEIDHLTLVYCGKAEEDLDEEEIEEVVDELAGVAAATPPIRAKVQGWAYFDGARKDGQPMTALVALVDAPGINELQVELREALADAGMDPSAEHSFSPHFTFAYLPPGGRVEGLPAISAEFTIDRVCFANREVHELELGSADVDVDDLDEEAHEHEEDEPADDSDPAAIVDRITPYQQRALKGEDRTALVATLELLMGVPPAMAERLIPGGSPVPPPPPAPPTGTSPPTGTRGDSADCAATDEEEEDREDCKNPIRGEGGRFAGCAPGEGSESGSGALHQRGERGSAAGEKAPAASRPARTRKAPAKPAAAGTPSAKPAPAKAPAKKLTPKQKERAVAKAAREKEKARKVKAKEREKAKREKERAKKTAAKEKAGNAKAAKAVKAAEKAAAKSKATNEKLAKANERLAAAKAATAAAAEKIAKRTGKTAESVIAEERAKRPPPPAPAAKPESKAAPTGRAFSDLATRAATSVPESGRYGQKVYVSEAFKEAKKESPSLTLDQFKRELVKSSQRGEVLLARADFPALMDKAAVANSEIEDSGQSFHFIVPQQKRNREFN